MAGLLDFLTGVASGAGGQLTEQYKQRQEQRMKMAQLEQEAQLKALLAPITAQAEAQAKRAYPSVEDRLNLLLLDRIQQEQASQQAIQGAQQRQRALEINPPPSPLGPMITVPAITEQGPGFVSGRAETNEGYPEAVATLPEHPEYEQSNQGTTPDQQSLLQSMLRKKFGLPLPSAMIQEEARAKEAGKISADPLAAVRAALEKAKLIREGQSGLGRLQALPQTASQTLPQSIKSIRKVKSGRPSHFHIPPVEGK